jgi:hypothetical protein
MNYANFELNMEESTIPMNELSKTLSLETLNDYTNTTTKCGVFQSVDETLEMENSYKNNIGMLQNRYSGVHTKQVFDDIGKPPIKFIPNLAKRFEHFKIRDDGMVVVKTNKCNGDQQKIDSVKSSVDSTADRSLVHFLSDLPNQQFFNSKFL